MKTINEQLEQHIDELRELRNGGMQVKDIAKKYDINVHTMSAFLVNHGICWRRKITDEDVPDIISSYLDGDSMYNIARRYRVTPSKITNLLKENNTVIRSRADDKRKYSLNESYFDLIDDQNKAYILGLLIADGNCNGDTSVRLQLQESDKDILEKINCLIGSDRPLRFVNLSKKNPNHKDAWLLEFNSKHMRSELEKYSIVPKKDFKTFFPTSIPESLYRHVIRGIMDGDGSIGKTERRCDIVGNKPLIEFLVSYIEEALSIHCSNCIQHHSDRTRSLRISGGRQVKKFLDYIYENATLFINRKFNVYQSIYCT